MEESHAQQQADLSQHHHLPPVEPGNLLTAAADHLRSKDTQRKGQQRDQIPEDAGQIPGKGPLLITNDVSRLGIGENLSPDAVGVSVLQPAGQGQKTMVENASDICPWRRADLALYIPSALFLRIP